MKKHTACQYYVYKNRVFPTSPTHIQLRIGIEHPIPIPESYKRSVATVYECGDWSRVQDLSVVGVQVESGTNISIVRSVFSMELPEGAYVSFIQIDT